MLTLIRSSAPCLPILEDGLPAVARALFEEMRTRPESCLWVVPTRRRLRFLERNWLARSEQHAALAPAWQTLEGFVQETLAFSEAWLPAIESSERLFLVARAWEQVSGRPAGAGLLGQLDRFQRDCQAVRDPVIARDLFRRFTQAYQDGLERRGRLDRMAALRTLTGQLARREPGLLDWLSRYTTFFFDGFHRFEPGELDLLGQLSELGPVSIWLVGTRGQSSWLAAEFAVDYLQQVAQNVTVVDADPPCHPLAELGRRLFPLPGPAGAEDHQAEHFGLLPCLGLATAPTAFDEVEQIAALIKTELRQAEAQGRPMRLSEIALVLPGPAYDPLIREVFPRAGLPFNLAGRALDLASSRPARLLLSALAVIGGQWRADLLLDFFMLPVVRWRLKQVRRLHDLFDERPRQRQQLDYGVWSRAWKQHLQAWSDRLAEGERQTSDDENPVALDVEREALDQTTRLIESLEQALAPVRALEQSLVARGGTNFLNACIELLEATGMAEWLGAPVARADRDEPLLAELHKDQQAYAQLLSLLRTLATIPAAELPKLADGHTDWLRVANLALANEAYQIRTVDDAGVQVFEIREIRGLTFRHVYMLGLVNGQVPALPEEGALAELRREDVKLAQQLALKESEAEWSFAQLFEAAREKLILSRPCREASTPVEPSRFLTAVPGLTASPVLEAPACLVNIRSAAATVGRRVSRAAPTLPTEQVWPGLATAPVQIAAWAASARAYRRIAFRRELELDLPLLLPQVLTESRSFSPSELEKYAACPFRFFGSRLLRLEEREAETTRLQYGSFVHKVLEESYIRIRQRTEGITEDMPLQPVRAEFRVLFQEIFQEEWQKIQQGVLPRELHTLFQEKYGVGDTLLEIIELLEEENGLGNLRTEYEFKDLELGHDEQGRPVYMTGVVDRIDLDRNDPGRAFVFDYKTGKNRRVAERQAKSLDGRLLQLALYGYAVGKRLGKEVVGAAYLYLNEGRNSKELKLQERIGHEGKLTIKGKACPSDYDVERTRRIALDLVSEIRSGNISLTKYMDGKYSECTPSCAMRSACRHEVVAGGGGVG
jgi:RecB family exonuclease/superfamily I DNA/RNA helicase